MATISKTGIQDGLTSKAEHITRIIDALDGTATTEVVATGSFTGSFDGVYTGTVVSASYAVTASHALNGGGGGGIFVQTGSHVPRTFRNDTGNLFGFGWNSNCSCLETDKCSDKDHGCRNSNP